MGGFMRRLLVVSIAIVGCVLSGTTSDALAVEKLPMCQQGQEASMSGTISGELFLPGKLLSTGINKYWSFPVDVTGGDCWTDLVVRLSKGAPPASCVEGSRVEVAGVVEEEDEGGFVTDPEMLNCQPGSTAP